MRSLLKAALLSGALFALPSLAADSQSPDGFITSKTKLSLWTTAGVRSTTVHVDTNDGVITLYGKVPTAEQRVLAEKTAAGIDGVRSVKNLLQVVAVKDEPATARTDKEIKEAIEMELRSDGSLKDSRISLKSVDKGVVLLTGTAASYADHLHAISLVDTVAGVRRIATEVKSPGDYRADERLIFLATDAKKPAAQNGMNDARISTAVKLRLFTAADVPSTEINVDTERAVVTLFGIVPTAAIRTAAGNEAGKVDGVKRVDNQLEVVAPANKKVVDAKDDDITRDLALTFKDRPEQRKVTTAVKNGTVRLTGTVTSGWAELNTLRLTRGVNGVRGIENQLKVEQPGT